MTVFLGHLLHHASGRIGVALLGGIILLTCWPSLVGAHSPEQIDLQALLQPPSWQHPLGTDLFGRDLLSRILYGGRHTLVIGMGVVSIAFTLGVVIGSIAGFKGRWVDSIALRYIDAVLSFSAPLLALALSPAIGAG